METSMDIQDSSIPKPSPEIHEEGNSEAGNLEGTATDVAPQEDFESIRVHEGGSLEGMATNEASQDGRQTPRVMRPVPKVEVVERYRSLFEAAVKGDWKGVEEILNRDPHAITATILNTASGPATVRDIAVTAGQDQLVENLVKRVRTTNEATNEATNENSTLRCALYLAARSGRIRKIKELVRDVGSLDVNFALSIAIETAPRHKEVIWYLAKLTRSFPRHEMMNLITAGHWDILLYLVKRHPEPWLHSYGQIMLQIFRCVKSFYRSGARLNFWEECIYQCIPPSTWIASQPSSNWTASRWSRPFKDLPRSIGKVTYRMLSVAPFINRIAELKMRHDCLLELVTLNLNMVTHCYWEPFELLQLIADIVVGAAFSGILEFVKLCLEQYPELMWDKDFTKQLLEGVVRARHVELFRLLKAYTTIRRLENDLETNCDLMMAVVEWSPGCVPAHVSGSAFLMQRELQWFEVLEDRSSPILQSQRFEMKVMKDESDPSSGSLKLEPTEKGRGKTYWEVFVEQRKDLLQEAGQWMKDTSTSCSLVATLITTVAFAAAFTVPGGNDNRGIPIFLKTTSFMIFTIADALALFSSITAILMFLAILTSRYSTRDFLHSLPRKMILGLTFLFLSLAFMLLAFGSALMIVLRERWKWIYIPITSLAAVPVILFAMLQLPLYVEMVESTYWPRLYRPVKIWK